MTSSIVIQIGHEEIQRTVLNRLRSATTDEALEMIAERLVIPRIEERAPHLLIVPIHVEMESFPYGQVWTITAKGSLQ